jgi:phosphoglycolate phosphatase-like HAD superfamily hydrolase
VHDAGGRVIVITSKFAANARRHLDHLGVVAEEVIGWAYGEGKRDALIRHRAVAFVGDYVEDMRAAVAARVAVPGLIAVGVPTGPSSPAELTETGADVVLPDLLAFPGFVEDRQSSWATGDVSLA